MFHTECVGSVCQVSICWSGATFPLVASGEGGRAGAGAQRGWTALTLSVNPIMVAELRAGSRAMTQPGSLPAYSGARNDVTKPQRLCHSAAKETRCLPVSHNDNSI